MDFLTILGTFTLIENKNIWFDSIKTHKFLYQTINFVEILDGIIQSDSRLFNKTLNEMQLFLEVIPIFLQDKILKVEVFHYHMDICTHGFQRETCQLCKMEMRNIPPVQLVEDMKNMELIGPKPRIKDNLSKLHLPDLTIQPISHPEPLISSSDDPNKQIINPKQDLITKDELHAGTEIINPKKKYLMKK